MHEGSRSMPAKAYGRYSCDWFPSRAYEDRPLQPGAWISGKGEVSAIQVSGRDRASQYPGLLGWIRRPVNYKNVRPTPPEARRSISIDLRAFW